MLLLPQGVGLVAAVVGAILGRYVPTVSVFPSEALTRSAVTEELSGLVRHANAALVVCAQELESEVRATLIRDGIAIQVTSERPTPVDGADYYAGPVQPDRPAIVRYCSGATRLKNAVSLTNRALLSQIWMLRSVLRVDRQDVVVSWLPLHSPMGVIASLLFPLLNSIPVVLISQADWIRRPEMLLKEVHNERGTLCWMPNFAFIHSAQQVGRHVVNDLDLGCLRAVINCSEPVTAHAMESFYRAFSGCGLMYSALASSYTLAETICAVTQTAYGMSPRTIRIDDEEADRTGYVRVLAPGDMNRRSRVVVSSGRPLSQTRVRVVNALGEVLDDERVGEIIIQSPSMAPQYYADLGSTASAFRNGWYHSGDLGFLREGELYVTGRQSDTIIVAGAHVFPHQLEEAVGSVPGVRSGRSVAFGVVDESLGTERVVILLETDTTCQDTEEQVKAHVRRTVLERWSVPVHDIQIMPTGMLATTGSGKLWRRRNKELYLSLKAESA